ncbi:hypothetical protein [Pyxidicoccus xibeiensis]|uniref:hypothetical protein n=1 Tax=Pyxidicoccus xibeiensis TaxID=2906759 RepID=UPI0020A80ACB|nr:hypothetical protein [Pyxidicoccus xibeiensis]MCP3141849.1 hypothetical protein [Pyxidicoccus xibeiensis]
MQTVLCLSALALSLGAAPVANPQLDLGAVGAVSVHQRCAPAARPELERGVALLHSFFYEEARTSFQKAAERDPRCATAWWGEAMTYYHPLWAPPSPEGIAAGTAAADRALKLGGKSPIEVGLISAIHAYWHDRLPPGVKSGSAKNGSAEGIPSCHGGAPTPGGRAEAFRATLEDLHRRFPADVEVTAFYSLALLGTAPKEDRSLAQQKRAAGLLERAWASHPKHPGLVHYLIHAYDYPEIAQQGLKAADAYAAVAPQVPHALHMPSHIYVRLGQWNENIRSNLRSIEAASRWMAVRHPGGVMADTFHALDYLGYGYLQQGREKEARDVVRQVATEREVYPPLEFPAAFARAMAPARFVLEREAWAEAAKLEVAPITASERFPFVNGLVVYTRGIGAARMGDVQGARAAAAQLAEHAKAVETGPYAYFGKLLTAHRLAVLGWTAHVEKKDAEAKKLLAEAAALEEAIGPHQVSPGPLLPSRELLGDLLLELGEPGPARSAYEQSLVHAPGRLRSLGGAMRAAARAGDAPLRKSYAKKVLALAGESHSAIVSEARAMDGAAVPGQ